MHIIMPMVALRVGGLAFERQPFDSLFFDASGDSFSNQGFKII